MTPEKREGLESAGFRVGDAADFLGLTPQENEMVEVRVSLARLVSELRRSTHMTQKQLAARIGSDPARISRLESADLSVSVDQMLEAAFALGASRKDIADVLAA
jgi:ribosome-binding protein aMBF1 (putative translation factor)